MDQIIRKLFTCLILAASSSVAYAQSDAPCLTMHSENYDLYGDANEFLIMLGSTKTGVIEVDCGYGREVYDIAPVTYNTQTGSMAGTVVSCSVNSDGYVRIYAPEDIKLDYVNVSGCGLTSFEMAEPEYVQVLNVEHNSITALDLTAYVNTEALYLGDNPYAHATPLVIGAPKDKLVILDLDVIDNADQSFSLADYPSLVSFDAMSCPWLTTCDPTHCPELMKISIDATNVTSIDVTQNPKLRILNVSDTGISELDLSQNLDLRELYCDHTSGTYNTGTKISNLDLSSNTELLYLFCSGNNLTDIDLSNNTKLQDLYIRYNYLTEIDLSANPALNNVMISRNFFNFNTLPINPGTWMGYEYAQRPIQVPRSYLVGTELNLAPYLVRPDSETYGQLFYISEEHPEESVQVEESKYTFANGVLTINAEIPDSVYCEFYNPLFPDANLRTSMFMVKNADEYGKPHMAMMINAPNLTTSSRVKLYIGVSGAKPDAPKTFYVDMGDGTLQPFTTTTATTPDQPNVNVVKGCYGAIKVYTEETDDLTAFAFYNSFVSDIDLSNSRQLAELTLVNTQMYEIDLSYNNRLEKLVLNGNHFGDNLTLAGYNGAYNKNILSYIDLKKNEMTKVVLSPVDAIKYLDLSNNALSELNFTDAEFIHTLNLSHNNFEFLKINYLSALRDLDVSYNKLTQIIMPETNNIDRFVLDHNCFTMANLPERNGLSESNYKYAPQAEILIPTKGPSCDLSDQAVVIDGNPTVFTWVTSLGQTLVEGVDYTIADGLTTFTSESVGKKAYCMITNASLPAFIGVNALHTNEMEISTKPQYVIGTFTTTDEAPAITLSLASVTPSNAIYIDWGNGELVQYPLDVTYTLFTAEAKANADVKIYSYDAINNLSVFSIGGVRMKDVDFANMKQLQSLSISGAGINTLIMPESSTLFELYLAGNKFTEFDLAAYPGLQFVSFQSNNFTEADLTGLTQLENISFANNKLESVRFGGNPNLWGVYLNDNKLTSVDLTSLEALHQVTLNYNHLSEIDLEGLTDLRVIFLDHNDFTFASLPLPREQWTLYIYNDQNPIQIEEVNGTVDLSSQAVINGVSTLYQWYEGMPQYDYNTGELIASELIEGLEYTIADGVTTFLTPISDVVCLMTNECFPNAVQYSTMIDVTLASINDVATDAATTVKVAGRKINVKGQPGQHISLYTLQGTLLTSGQTDVDGNLTIPATAGAFIVSDGLNAYKVMVK